LPPSTFLPDRSSPSSSTYATPAQDRHTTPAPHDCGTPTPTPTPNSAPPSARQPTPTTYSTTLHSPPHPTPNHGRPWTSQPAPHAAPTSYSAPGRSPSDDRASIPLRAAASQGIHQTTHEADPRCPDTAGVG